MIQFGERDLMGFKAHLAEQERSPATIRKYLHDVGLLLAYSSGKIDDRTSLNGFKQYLQDRAYNPSSINSMLAAVNCFLAYLGSDWKLRYVKVQRKTFLPADRELQEQEYRRMIQTAKKLGDHRLSLLVQTICSLGIRVSELKAITVESLETGEAMIQNKGKLRVILIPENLVKKLRHYCKANGLNSGSVFVTRTGNPLDRSNIWKMMKRLAGLAQVAASKVFPHNLRHLFARKYYETFKDIVRLADILGHSSVDTTRIYTAGSGQEERRQLGQLRLVLD